ncbi:MAG: S8 family serine peptidase [Acidobacteriota bacterium]
MDALARLSAANADFERRDAALQKELQEVRARARVTPEGRPVTESIDPRGQVISEQFTQETIVRRTGRPVLAIIRNQARLVFEEADSPIWKERLERAGAALALAASAVGRVEVQGHSLAWLGTGWLVSPDIIVTNRHVAEEFGRRRGAEFVFRQGIAGAAMTASIDFLEELERQDSLSFGLSEILHIEDEDGPDLAFLRVRAAGGPALAKSIALSAALPQLDETVAVIGYPARDSRIPDLDLMDRIYGTRYDKKRLAPGQILQAGPRQLRHDCTTLGGNSGSAVISLATGEAVGLHFAGTFLTANFAVPSIVVQQRLEQLTRTASTRRAVLPPPTEGGVIDAPAQSGQPAPARSAASVSFNLPLRVTVDIDAPAAGGGVSVNVASQGSEDLRQEGEGEPATDPPPPDAPRPERIAWSADVFSVALSEALARYDSKAADTLIKAFEQHAASRSYPQAALYANRDLAALRKKRQFVLMRRYAEAASASGTQNMRVQRQHGQALIELGEFDAARAILQDVVTRGDVNRDEEFEALGLIGRSYKQEYVDHPADPEAGERLRRAVEAYQSVYGRNESMLWHGINVATCTLRAHRDGLQWADASRAQRVANAVFEKIQILEAEAKDRTPALDVWDYATRVEALLILNRIAEAEASLDVYLAHPDMDAFEVSSTHRQFTQMLQMPPGTRIMERLREAVERFRGGGALGDAATPLQDARVSVLLRVSDPNWQPQPSDVLVHSRTGGVITAEGSRDSLRRLLQDPAVISLEESRPGGTTECVRSVPFINVNVNAQYVGPEGTVYTERGDGALIAVIDDGIDIQHQAFLAADGTPRIVSIWDQTNTGTPPAGFTYGAYYDAAAIAAAVAAKVDLGIGRNDEGHGTHVASIAAGRACGSFAGGVAPEASLLVVITDNRSSIGYSRPHADALVFIDDEATRLKLPVVVNVSQGMNAGAHDGKSPLETRFNAFCSASPGRVVVKSAGNEGDQEGHAKFSVGQDMLSTLQWRRAQAAQWPSEHIELWWRYGNELEFRLGSPSGLWSPWVTRGQARVTGMFASDGVPPMSSAGGTGYRLELVPSHPNHGDSLLRIDLDSATEIQSGVWQLDVVGRKVGQEATIHAWIERGDPVPSRFKNFQSNEVTLSIPGTAEYVITVGAIDPARPIRVGPFSSLGPTRDNREKPDVVAPGVAISAARSGTATDVVKKDGTSMAAPHVTGAIALVLSKGKKAGDVPTAMQIAVALRQNTLNHTSRWTGSEGYGVIDVTALLAAF